MDTRTKGEVAKLKVMIRAAELGFTVSLPTSEVRYDMILERDGRCIRAQVKYAAGQPGHASGSIRLALYRRGKRYLQHEVDAILVYLPVLDQICWFDSAIFHNKHILQIRYEPTKSGQSRGCLMARDFVW